VKYKLVYIRHGVNAPRAGDIKTREVYAMHAAHAAVRAASFERRTGARVLTVRPV
jgi:hypothetical protein